MATDNSGYGVHVHAHAHAHARTHTHAHTHTHTHKRTGSKINISIFFQMHHISGDPGLNAPKHVAAGFGAEKSFVTVYFAKERKPHATVSTAKVAIWVHCGTR